MNNNQYRKQTSNMYSMNITSAVIIAVVLCIPMGWLYKCYLERLSGNIVERPQDRLSNLENTQQVEI